VGWIGPIAGVNRKCASYPHRGVAMRELMRRAGGNPALARLIYDRTFYVAQSEWPEQCRDVWDVYPAPTPGEVADFLCMNTRRWTTARILPPEELGLLMWWLFGAKIEALGDIYRSIDLVNDRIEAALRALLAHWSFKLWAAGDAFLPAINRENMEAVRAMRLALTGETRSAHAGVRSSRALGQRAVSHPYSQAVFAGGVPLMPITRARPFPVVFPTQAKKDRFEMRQDRQVGWMQHQRKQVNKRDARKGCVRHWFDGQLSWDPTQYEDGFGIWMSLAKQRVMEQRTRRASPLSRPTSSD